MTDIYRKASIKARYIAGDTYGEIAKVLKLGRSVVAGHIYRMRDELPPRITVPPRGRDHKPRKPKEFKPRKPLPEPILRPARIVVHQDVPKYVQPRRKELSRKELREELHQAVLNTK